MGAFEVCSFDNYNSPEIFLPQARMYGVSASPSHTYLTCTT